MTLPPNRKFAITYISTETKYSSVAMQCTAENTKLPPHQCIATIVNSKRFSLTGFFPTFP